MPSVQVYFTEQEYNILQNSSPDHTAPTTIQQWIRERIKLEQNGKKV